MATPGTAQESSWIDDLVTDWNTGGKYHNIWEGIENVGRNYRDNVLLKDDTPTPEQMKKQVEYKQVQNQEVTEPMLSKSNITYLAIGGVALLIVLNGFD